MKLIGIEDLLRWTYGDELAQRPNKGPVFDLFFSERSNFCMVADVLALGATIDRSGFVPSAVGWAAPVGPNPDALLVHDAVLRLAGSVLAMPEDFDALGDIEGLTASERADAHRNGFDLNTAKRDRLAALVMRRAKVGNEPTWRDHGPISRRPVLASNGRERWFRIVNASAGPGRPAVPQEVEGYDKRNGRPFRGAFRKFYLDPCPSLLVAERIEYQAWALALGLLADELRGTLGAHTISEALPPLWPWESGQGRIAPRILSPSLSTGSQEPLQPA